MKELWVKIKGFENYEISNFGRIKRLEHTMLCNPGNHQKGPHYRHYKERIIEDFCKCGGNRNGSKGLYSYVILTNRSIQKVIAVHRLVAEYFCDNPNGYKEIDHIDRNPSNNRADNLRWVTRSENCLNKNKKVSAKKSV